MTDYKVEAKQTSQDGSKVKIKVCVTLKQGLDYPRVSACFYTKNDNRIVPMKIEKSDGQTVVATGTYDMAYLFYKPKFNEDINVKFLLINAKAENIILEPDEELIIKKAKKRRIRHIIQNSAKENIKLILSRVLNLMFLPYRAKKVNPNKVAFLSNRSDKLSGNIKAVFHEMTKINGLEIIVLCKKGNLRDNIPNLFKFFKIYATSKVVFVDDYYHLISYVNKKDDVTLIQLWHACGAFKTFGFSRLGKHSELIASSPNHRQYDYVIVSSKNVMPFYAEGFGVALQKIVPLGSPRCDVFTDETYKKAVREKFYKKYPNLRDKKLIVFSPTFRGGGLGNCYYNVDKFEIDKILSSVSEEYCIIIKMHPYLKETPRYSEVYRDRVIEFNAQFDVNDLLFVTDLLITDYSSVIFEASLLNIPMLFYAYDLKEYCEDRDFYCHYENFVPGKIVYTTQQLIQAINNNDYCEELLEPFRKRFFAETAGKATDNVVEFTKQILE